jgi:hypothetical protein
MGESYFSGLKKYVIETIDDINKNQNKIVFSFLIGALTGAMLHHLPKYKITISVLNTNISKKPVIKQFVENRSGTYI